LQKLGYRVLVVPEVATKLIGGGISPKDPKLGFPAFQRLVVTDLVHQEATFLAAARHFAAAGEKVVVLPDRGGIEGVAYLGGDEPGFAAMVKEFGWQPGDLCEGRYHAGIHLVTAAIGAEKHYSLRNKARYETPEEAIAIDGLLARSWLRHPHLRVIDNRTDFPTKLKRMLDEIKAVLGEPMPLETEDKYLVRVDMDALVGMSARSLIVQDYLSAVDGQPLTRIRKRESADGYVVYYETQKGELIGRSRTETERAVNKRRYEQLLETRDPCAATVVKDRYCFLYEGRFFELDRFRQPIVGLTFLEIERLPHESKDSIKLPPFVEVVSDVSEDPRYSNRQIAINRSIPDS
jgi:CYTH domain-containing protein